MYVAACAVTSQPAPLLWRKLKVLENNAWASRLAIRNPLVHSHQTCIRYIYNSYIYMYICINTYIYVHIHMAVSHRFDAP